MVLFMYIHIFLYIYVFLSFAQIYISLDVCRYFWHIYRSFPHKPDQVARQDVIRAYLLRLHIYVPIVYTYTYTFLLRICTSFLCTFISLFHQVNEKQSEVTSECFKDVCIKEVCMSHVTKPKWVARRFFRVFIRVYLLLLHAYIHPCSRTYTHLFRTCTGLFCTFWGLFHKKRSE